MKRWEEVKETGRRVTNGLEKGSWSGPDCGGHKCSTFTHQSAFSDTRSVVIHSLSWRLDTSHSYQKHHFFDPNLPMCHSRKHRQWRNFKFCPPPAENTTWAPVPCPGDDLGPSAKISFSQRQRVPLTLRAPLHIAGSAGTVATPLCIGLLLYSCVHNFVATDSHL